MALLCLKKATFKEYILTSIGSYAFEGCSGIASVEIGNSVTSIGSSAFRGCAGLTSVVIPNSVTSIGNDAFQDCSSLETVKIGNSVTSIGSNAFYDCSNINKIYITDVAAWCNISGLSNLMPYGASVKTLYVNNEEATDVVIPNGPTTIPAQAFRNFKCITSVTVPNSMISIGQSAFEGCSEINEIYITDVAAWCNISGLEYLTNYGASIKTLYLNNVEATDVVIPNGTTTIPQYAFRNFTNLTSVTVPNSVTSIGSAAFSGCSGLESMTLPFVGNSATSPNEKAVFGYIFGNSRYEGGILISQYYSSNALNAFYCPANLREVTITGEKIPFGAFSNCSFFSKVDVSSATSIGPRAFYACSALKSIGELSACESIGEQAFYSCSDLTSIGELKSCTSIGKNVFANCYNLPNTIVISNDAVATLGGVLPDYFTVMVPADLVDEYRTTAGWNEMPYRIIPIGAQTVYDNVAVTMPATGSGIQNAIGEKNLGNVVELKVVGDINAYDIFILRNNMPNLHKLDLSDANIKAVTDGSAYKYYNTYTTSDDVLGDYAFYQQTKLLDVKLPRSIKAIGEHTFRYCSNLCNVEFYPGVETIGYCAFHSCSKLNNTSIKEGLKDLGSFAFGYCYDLKEIIIPEGTITLNSSAFIGCSNLRKVTLPSTLQSLGSNCFSGCSNLKDINLPSNLTTISGGAFQSCSSLEEITLPTKLTSIGSSAFGGCTKLNTVRVTALDSHSVTISDNTFASYNTATLYIPKDEETGWDATYQSYYWNTQWGQFFMKDTWTPSYDDVLINGDYDQDKGTIPGEDINAEIGNNGGYIVGGNADQDFNDVDINTDATNGQGGSIIVENGGNLDISALRQWVNVAANKWYFFCFPFDVVVADIEVKGQYVLYKYDGEQRANEKSGWVKLTADDTTLLAGQGYIFQTNTACKIKVPATNPQFNSDDKMTVLQVYPANNKNDASWNLVGNPYLAYYNLEDLGYTAPITYWDGTTYRTVRKGDDDYAVQPLQAFFVQTTVDENGNKNDIEFPVEGCETYLQSKNTTGQAKAARAQSKINPDRLILNLVISDGENEDKTRVVFNDKQQMEYEPECDAAKFMSSEDVPQLYSVYNNVQYAINERPVMNGDVQLGFKATKAGTYSIAMRRMDTPMLLKDNELGVTFDFANGEYTFDAQAGSNEHRFTLLMNGDPTAVKPVTVGDAESATYFNTAGQRTNASSKGIVIEKTGNSVKKVLNK